MNISEILLKSKFVNPIIKELYIKSSELTRDNVQWFTQYTIEKLCEEVNRIKELEDELSDAYETISSLEDEVMSEREENESLKLKLNEK